MWVLKGKQGIDEAFYCTTLIIYHEYLRLQLAVLSQCCQGVKPELFLHPVTKYLIRPRKIAQLRHFTEAELLTLKSFNTNLSPYFFMPHALLATIVTVPVTASCLQ